MNEGAKSNRAFEEMKKAALQQLQGADPLIISKHAGIDYNTETRQFKIVTLAQEFYIDYPSFRILTELEEWYHLLVLHYLYQADGSPITGKLVGLGQLKDGLIRGTKFERQMEDVLSKKIHGKSEEEVWASFEKLGGVRRKGKADLCIELSFFPKYPVFFNIWLADEEFPVSVKMLVDKSADHYLSIEDAVTLGEILKSVL